MPAKKRVVKPAKTLRNISWSVLSPASAAEYLDGARPTDVAFRTAATVEYEWSESECRIKSKVAMPAGTTNAEALRRIYASLSRKVTKAEGGVEGSECFGKKRRDCISRHTLLDGVWHVSGSTWELVTGS